MTSQGSPYSRFKRALKTGNLLIIRAAAAELPGQVRLEDALSICLLLRDREPERFEAAAVRWIARYCVEHPAVTLGEIEEASRAFALMRAGQPGRALERLQALCLTPRPHAPT